MARDFLRSAITRHLAPELEGAGYYRVHPKHFIRVRGDIVGHVSFQASRWGGGFYVHVFANTLLDPTCSFGGYKVGQRLQSEEGGGSPWSAESSEIADVSVASVVRALAQRPLAWLNEIDNLKEYVFEYVCNPNAKLEDFELALVLARTGQVNRPQTIIDRLCHERQGAEESEHDARVRSCAKDLRSAFANQSVQALLEQWREQNIERHGLSADALTTR